MKKSHFELLRTATGVLLSISLFSGSEAGYRSSKRVRIVSKFCLTFTEGLLCSRHYAITEDINVSVYAFENIC